MEERDPKGLVEELGEDGGTPSQGRKPRRKTTPRSNCRLMKLK